ncbi:hypothetical protein SJA_C1-03710 [Sphingobium indicum UT26S]|uniref:Uncharacterized protein n=1 Tax=Sphingobium indicum (strain DSM 16413 / CCM 7287 / MTCC 6362 / UT26 / NBRC 101211 / UT26S) TaxID=452662 RepID=D4YXX3_SPHIU|nr:hypothetical protein SJA_C1-03710 [Sphingobium indicum UT26S]
MLPSWQHPWFARQNLPVGNRSVLKGEVRIAALPDLAMENWRLSGKEGSKAVMTLKVTESPLLLSRLP